jgi:hypothetical protein
MGCGDSDSNLASARLRLLQAIRETEAIYLLLNFLSVENQEQIRQFKEMAQRSGKKQLRLTLKQVRSHLSELRRKYGVKISNTELVETADAIKSELPRPDLLFPKHALRQIFSRYERALPEFDSLPEHAYIAVRVGTDVVRAEFGYGLLEAVLYEDLAALFNSAKRTRAEHDAQSGSKEIRKAHEALCRATVTAACNFVEAYLNGIAFDHFLLDEKDLDEETKGLLLDWDFKKNRTKYLSLRDKALQYPRIILALAHPPIDQDTCPELAFICGRAKVIRDSTMHPAPRKRSQILGPDKEQEVFIVDFGEVERAVDSAVGLVRKIERVIRGNDHRLFWLFDRGPDGLFPAEAFH